jgi:hypothetical protein
MRKLVMVVMLVGCAGDVATDAEVRDRVPCQWNNGWSANPDNIRMGCEAPCQSEFTLKRDGEDECIADVADGFPYVCTFGEWHGRFGCCSLTGMGAIFEECR